MSAAWRVSSHQSRAAGHKEGSIIAAIMIAHIPRKGPSSGKVIMPIAAV
jgi:hypothetical protein